MNIIGRRRLWFLLSSVLIVISIGSFTYNTLVHGEIMNFGIDFTGGTLINLRFDKWIPLDDARKALDKFDLGGDKSVIQRSGEKDILIRTEPLESDVRIAIVKDLRDNYGKVDLLEADTIGPVIGEELRTHAIWALIIASIGILIYVSFRFESYKYALAALVALLHDAIITTGLMALFWRTIDVAFVAGILTIMGYSINDSIVIFDRIRENLRKPGASKLSYAAIVNTSLIETLARSINTVLTSLTMVLALLFFGGATLKNFCLVLVIGFAAGTYSSIFLAAPLLVAWESRKRK